MSVVNDDDDDDDDDDVRVAVAELVDAEEAEVGDDDLALLEEDVLALQVFVHDVLGVQVAHTLHTKQHQKLYT